MVVKPRPRTATTTTSSSSSRRPVKRTRFVSETSAAPDVMSLVRELSNFARETIQAKDQLIQYLQQKAAGPAGL